jgi:hypothetical protein
LSRAVALISSQVVDAQDQSRAGRKDMFIVSTDDPSIDSDLPAG